MDRMHLSSVGERFMSRLAPPPTPPAIAADDEGARRYRLRCTVVVTTLITLLATAWVCTFGVIPAILALAVAKHVLVAVLAMGLGVDETRRPR
jgi:hypothetical protein